MASKTKLELIRGSTVLDISDELSYVHEANDGFGIPAVRRIAERGPLQHGDTDIDYRLEARTIQLVLSLLPSSWTRHYVMRDALMRMLAPMAVLQLRFTLPDNSQRQLDCFLSGKMSLASDDMVGKTIKVGFTLRSASPAWYDPTIVSVNFALAGAGEAWIIPWAIPWPIGNSALDNVKNIVYGGSFETYPVIYINGPITNPIIENETTDEKLDFTGISIALGDTYTIDCRYGYKTVLDNAGTNKIADLTTDSDLATFHLKAPDDGSASETNTVRVTGTGLTDQTNVLFTYYTQYLGA